jgi:hypothetical protein
MSTAIETLPSRHKVSWRGWIITLAAAALLAGAIGTYMALQSGSASPTKVVQTVKPATLTPVTNLQPGSTGQVIPNRIDGQYLPKPIAPNQDAIESGGKTGDGGTSSSAPGSSGTNCLSNVQGGPC